MSGTTLYSPMLHLNGSDGETLFAALAHASGAVRAAEVALGNAAPNARDYYVRVRMLTEKLGVELAELPFSMVAAAHEQRLRTLRDLRDELSAIAGDVRDQIDEREARKAAR